MQQELIRLAQAEVGVREQGGNNRGERIRQYQGATWLMPDEWPWCAGFTCWILQRWLGTAEGRAYLGGHKPEAWRCKDASAYGWEKWGVQKGLQVLPETALAKAGDFVTFDFSHIGIVVADQVNPGATIETVEGNTNGRGERDSVAGDGVWRKFRAPHLVKSYIRLGERAP